MSARLELPMPEAMPDEFLIRQAVENWVLCRDQGDWDGLRALWHADGIMIATWFQGSASEFIDASRRAWESGSVVHHFLGGSRLRIIHNRAIAQTKMSLAVRAPVHGVLCDVTCTGRFFDHFEKVRERWLLARRQLIYEKDRLDPVAHTERVDLEPALLSRFPVGYRHLAYLQVNAGQSVLENLPGLRGDAVEQLTRNGDHWLATGEDINLKTTNYTTYPSQVA